MPELPEVETVRSGLDQAVRGAVIQDVRLMRPNLRTSFPANFIETLTGKRIHSVARRAKYLLFHLDMPDILLAHLGMSGRFSVVPQQNMQPAPHDHVLMQLTDGRVIIYNDARRFGLMTLAQSTTLTSHPLLASLGPEPFSNDFSAAYLKHALSRRSGPIKPALMDQALVVGVGNIYACETLFMTGIHPATPAAQASEKAKELIAAIRSVLQEAIDSGGSSLRDFIHISGESGYFQHRFQVYGRMGKPCYRCQSRIEAIKQAGRSTFFCPECQK